MTEKETQIDDVQLARGNEYLHALVPYGPNKMVRELTRRIMALDKSKIPLNIEEAHHTAQLSLSTDLNYFANEIWAWITINKKTGRREYHWMPGRLGFARHCNKQAKEMGIKLSHTEPAELTLNERARLKIATDSLAVKVILRDDVEMATYNESLKTLADTIGKERAYEQLGPPPGSSGIGVVTKKEMDELDRYGTNSMPHINRAAKRALTEARKGKFSLQFGSETFGAPADYSEYVLGDVIEGDWEDIPDAKPFGLDPELFGSKERLDPKNWGNIPVRMVEEELAADAFVAAEILAYTPLIPKGLKVALAIKLFTHAKEIYLEDEERPLKEVAEIAYGRIFETDKEKTERLSNDKSPEEKPPAPKPESKKPAPKKPEPKPKKESKKELPKKPAVKVDDEGLNKNQIEALKAMAKDFPRYTPKHSQDWATAYKYIDLKKVTTTRDEFQKIVKNMYGDVRLGMARILGYL